jgi:hypothetical protein
MARRCHRLVAVLAFCIVASVAHSQEGWSNSPESFICKSSSEVMEIKTYLYDAPPGTSADLLCRVDYIKHGNTKTVWSSRSSRSYCNGKASQLAARLAARNFSCQRLQLDGGL